MDEVVPAEAVEAVRFAAVAPPDAAARRAAEQRQAVLTKPAGSLGRLEQLGVWLSACQGVCPPRPLSRVRVVVFAGDHGIARHGVSAYPSEVTAQMVANFRNGTAAVNVLAEAAGATVRVADLAVDADTDESVSGHKVRRSSGPIDRADALTEAEVRAALAAGRAIADEEIDQGADLLIAGDMGIGNTTPAAVLIAALTGSEPVAVVGRGTGIDDHGWMRKTAAIRDALRRARPVSADPVGLLRTSGGADLAAMAGFLAQAAIRRTPVLLDGVVVGAAAMVAEELAPGAREWWQAGHRSVEPAHTIVLDHLDLTPLLEFNLRLGEGSGAVAALPLVTMAGRILSDMATFEQAGVSGPSEAPPAVEPGEPVDAVMATAAGLAATVVEEAISGEPDSASTAAAQGYGHGHTATDVYRHSTADESRDHPADTSYPAPPPAAPTITVAPPEDL